MQLSQAYWWMNECEELGNVLCPDSSTERRKKEREKAVAEQLFCKEMKKPAADSTQDWM